jgi:hypothetical protein
MERILNFIVQSIAGMFLFAMGTGICTIVGAGLTVATLGFGGVIGIPIAFAGPWIVAGLLLSRLDRKKGNFAFALSPVTALMLWALVSIGFRIYYSHIGAQLAGNENQIAISVRPETVILDKYGSGDNSDVRSLLANRIVDQLVLVSRDKKELVELSQRNQCSEEEIRDSQALAAAARIEECYKSRELQVLPDGLRITCAAYIDQLGCKEYQVFYVKSGRDQKHLYVSQTNSAKIPAYLPFWDFSNWSNGKLPTVWENFGGPVSNVAYGDTEVTRTTLIKKFLGADPNTAVEPKTSDVGELTKTALKLLEDYNSENLRSAMNIVSPILRDGHRGTELALAVARIDLLRWRHLETSTKSEKDYDSSLPKRNSKDWKDFADAQSRAALNELSVPKDCRTCLGEASFWAPETVRQQALAIFREKNDLKFWQYYKLLKSAQLSVRGDYENVDWQLRRSLFEELTNDKTNPLKFFAFLKNLDGVFLDTEIPFLVVASNTLNDEQLRQFLADFYPPNSAEYYQNKAGSEQLVKKTSLKPLKVALSERIKWIVNDELRHELKYRLERNW